MEGLRAWLIQRGAFHGLFDLAGQVFGMATPWPDCYRRKNHDPPLAPHRQRLYTKGDGKGREIMTSATATFLELRSEFAARSLIIQGQRIVPDYEAHFARCRDSGE